MRRAAKVDHNHATIVQALRQVGATVQSLAAVGQGCPDLLVARGGTNYLLEIKNPAQRPSDQRLTPDEQQWHQVWRGHVVVVRTVDEALKAVGAI